MQTVTVPMESLAEIIHLQLNNGGTANLRVTGSSMWPLFLGGRDSVTLSPPRKKYKRGDILLYKRDDGSYVLHRIIAMTASDYICSGDNQAVREVVTDAQVVAVVNGFTRKGKYYSTQAMWYRLYKTVWINLFLLRKPFIKLFFALGRINGKLRHRHH